MKNKNIVIAVIIVILLLLLGAAGYLMLSKKANKTPQQAATANKQTQPQQTTKSLLDLVNLGQNLRCTFKSEVSNGSTEGTVYVSGKNVRGDFMITSSDGKQIQSSMITNGSTSYIWGSGLPTGIKMTISLDKLSQNNQASQYVNPNQKINYNCVPWNVDTSLFTVPSNVKFTDMTSLLAPKPTTTQAAPQTQTQTAPSTDPCSRISDPTAKTACQNALKQSGY